MGPRQEADVRFPQFQRGFTYFMAPRAVVAGPRSPIASRARRVGALTGSVFHKLLSGDGSDSALIGAHTPKGLFGQRHSPVILCKFGFQLVG